VPQKNRARKDITPRRQSAKLKTQHSTLITQNF